MHPDFNALAAKAYDGSNDPAALNALWSAVYNLEQWHFLIPPGTPLTQPSPFVTQLEGKLAILVFTDSDLLAKAAKQNEIYKEGDQIPFYSVPTESVIPYLTQFAQHNIWGVWFNATVAHGFYAPLDNLQAIFDHLQKIGAIADKKQQAQKEPQREQPTAPQKQPVSLLQDLGFALHKDEQHLAAAMVFTELARTEPNNTAAWCGLGACLCKSAGVLVRKPFFENGAKAFRRCLELSAEGEYAEVCRDWLKSLEDLPETKGLPALAMRADELPALLKFLDVDPNTLPNAVQVLPEGERMGAVMALGDTKSVHFVPVLLAAIEGKWDDGCARSALKRLPAFPFMPQALQLLKKVAAAPRAEELEPYLSATLQALEHESKKQTPPATPPKQASEAPRDDAPKTDKKWWQFWR